MNYLKAYCNLIRKAEKRTPPEGYTEKHHTFPKSIFGKNNRIVVLTAREHYVAHVLLEKIYIKRYGLRDIRTIKMNYAHASMKRNFEYINSYLYESARKRFSSNVSGQNNPMYGKTHTEEMKERLRLINTGKKRKKTEEHIEKQRQKMIGKKHTQEHIEKQREQIQGRQWWNNGKETKMSFNCPGDGWVLGRANEIKGRKWWNDGQISKMSVKCPGKDWTAGRMKYKTKRRSNQLAKELMKVLEDKEK